MDAIAPATAPAAEGARAPAGIEHALPKFDRGVSLLAWAYNEEEALPAFLERAQQLAESALADYELVLVDDGSTDRSPEILAAASRANPRIRVLTNERNLNIGYSAKRAFASARKEFLCWQTIDWSYDLSHLRIFLELLRKFDVVWGVRPTPERLLSHIPILNSIYRVRSRSDTLRKAVVSLVNYYVVRLLYGIDFHDYQNIGFLPTALVQSFALQGNTSFLGPELLSRAYGRGLRFLEVPIPFLPRRAGQAKGTRLRTILRSAHDILLNWFRWGWRFRLEHLRDREQRIFRVNEPAFLDDETLALVLPLFKYFR